MSLIRPIDRLMNVLFNTSNNKEFHLNEIFYCRTDLEGLIFIIKISMTLEDFSQTFTGLKFTFIFIMITKKYFFFILYCTYKSSGTQLNVCVQTFDLLCVKEPFMWQTPGVLEFLPLQTYRAGPRNNLTKWKGYESKKQQFSDSEQWKRAKRNQASKQNRNSSPERQLPDKTIRKKANL